MPDGRILDDRNGVGGHIRNLAFHTGREILDDPMVKKEGKLLDPMPSEEEVTVILNYLGEEGFLDDGKELDEDNFTWIEGSPEMRLAVGYLPAHKFKQLKHKLEQHG
jgi:hypothetical protein